MELEAVVSHSTECGLRHESLGTVDPCPVTYDSRLPGRCTRSTAST